MKRAKSPIELPGVVTASRDVPGGHRISIELEAERERVPGILLIPDRSTCGDRRAAALLLHGFTSRKERMAEGIGRALLAYSVATLAIDLPMHGARQGRFDEHTLRNPLQIVGTWRRALSEVHHSLNYLSNLATVDPQRLALVGYSLGAYLTVVAAEDPRVRSVVLASGGDLPDGVPFETLLRAAADPLRAVRKLSGRPLLMVNGRYDRTIKAEQAERLFNAAGDPKQIHWYHGGHWPPQPAIDFGARWLAEKLGSGEWRLVSGEPT